MSDADGSLRARYGVPKTLWLFPGRVTFLIDKEGIIRHYFSSMFQATKHVAERCAVLKERRRGPGWSEVGSGSTSRRAPRAAKQGRAAFWAHYSRVWRGPLALLWGVGLAEAEPSRQRNRSCSTTL